MCLSLVGLLAALSYPTQSRGGRHYVDVCRMVLDIHDRGSQSGMRAYAPVLRLR